MTLNKKSTFSWIKRWSLNILLFVIVLIAVNFWQTRNSASGKAPILLATTLQQNIVDLQTIKKPVLVHFWGTWCPLCGFEEGSIQSISEDMPIITIALQSGTDADLRKYMQDNELSFPVVNDDNAEISRRWGVQGVPASFIVDEKGDISHRSVGYTTEIALRIRLWLAGT